MGSDPMWIWWSLTLVICVWKIGEAFIWPERMLEWPFLASAMWAYFYVYMAYDAKLSLPAYLGNGITNIGQLMPLLCLVGILVGWKLGTGGKVPVSAMQPPRNYARFWWTGLAFTFIGAAGGYSIMHAVDTGTINFKESSGYWVLLFYVGYPGIAICLWALCKMEKSARFYYILATILAVVAFMYPHVSNARRGPLFPAIMVVLLVLPLARKRKPNPFIYMAVLGLAGLAMLLFLQIRHVTYNGGTWGEAVQTLSLDQATERAKNPEDNEYINNCQLIGTVFQDGKYQYGTGYMGLLWHWIPRQIWHDKPTLGEGSYTNGELFDDVEAATGFRLLGTGAAAGGVSDSFLQYGVFCPIHWMLLSWLFGAVYQRARSGNSPRWLFCYVGIICATHWLVSQGLAASFVPAMFFQAVPFAIFLLFDRAFQSAPVPVRRYPARQQAARQQQRVRS